MSAVRAAMAAAEVDVLLLSVGADLPWLTGYEAMPLERLTMLVVPVDGTATLVVPELEAPRVGDTGDLFKLRPWKESEYPDSIVAGLMGAARTVAISDRTWARFVLGLQAERPGCRWVSGSVLTAPLRAVKDADEVAALYDAARAADRVATQLLAGDVRLVGRTEAEVSADISRRLVAEGHDRVNFAIVASGPNAASPHHEAGTRVIERGDPVVCDFGGTMVPIAEREKGGSAGYCSDITRTVVAGGSPPPGFAEIYAAVKEAQAKGVAAATAGTPGATVDAASRRVIADAGYGEFFIHRTGHGIGVEEHEEPYLVAGNEVPLQPGNAFSIEPGVYITGLYGVRIEDIVVTTEDGPNALNVADHELEVVEA